MAIWPFNRKKKASDLPKEVQDYYQAEKRERVGVAGLLALATLVVTVLLAVGLFFGGRWIYRSVFDNDSDTTQTEQQGTVGDSAADKTNEPSNTSDQATTPAPAPTPAPATSSSSSSAASISSASSTSATSSSDLANTGPADTLAIILATTAISSLAFYLYRRPEEQ